ncbi:hypothetical protein [Streptomyces anulatus]|uniref:hypothetical protein n=1 Tax=Streptomyces anulatus TaxID=1892 RepID=UPI002F916D4A
MEKTKRLGLLIGLWVLGLLMVGLIPYAWSHEPGIRRVLWVFLAFGVLALSGLLTFVEFKLARRRG